MNQLSTTEVILLNEKIRLGKEYEESAKRVMRFAPRTPERRRQDAECRRISKMLDAVNSHIAQIWIRQFIE